MRLGLVLLVALVALPARAELAELAGESSSVVAARYQFGSTGGAWALGSNTAIHCRVNASGEWACPVGPSWSTVGAPGVVEIPEMAPGGFSAAGRKGQGPLGDTAYLQLGTGDDLLDSGLWQACALLRATTWIGSSGQFMVANDGNFNVDGWYAYFTYSGGVGRMAYKLNGAGSNSTAVSSVDVPLNSAVFVCWGEDEANVYAQTDGTRGSLAKAVVPVPATSTPLRLGRATASGFSGQIVLLEFAVRSGAWSDAWANSLWRQTRAMQGSLGEPLTVTRVSAQSVVLTKADGSPFVASVPAGTLAIGESGAEIHGPATSRMLWNQDLSNAAWTKRGVAACVPSPIAAPDGSMTAWRCTVQGAGANDVYQVASGHSLSTALAPALWVDKGTNTGLLFVSASAGTGAWQVNLDALPAGWVRLTATHPAVTVATPFVSNSSGAGGLLISSAGSAYTIAPDLWRPWLVEGVIPGPDAEVAGSALPRPGTAGALAHGLSNVNKWAVSFRGGRESWASSVGGLWSFGAAGTNDTCWAYANTNGNLYFVMRDSAGDMRSWTFTHGFINGSAHTVVFALDNGAAAVTVDGVRVTVAGGTGGTGRLLSLPSMYFGSVGSAAQSPLSGFVSEIITCNTAIPELCR